MMATFQHAPLPTVGQHVRLLQFDYTHKPHHQDDHLRLSLRPYDLSERPVYNALSYEWGTVDAARLVFVNDQPFFIRENLYNFLVILSSTEHSEASFFADAICINQVDILERNAHVKKMGELYREAQSVLVWLGPATPESDLIFDMCADPGPAKVETEDGTSTTGKLESIDFNRPDGEALDTIYQRSYWTRLWIIQELFLAREAIFYCGSKSTTWSIFKRLPTSNKGVFTKGGFSGMTLVLGSTAGGRQARDILSELNKRSNGQNAQDKPLHELVTKFGRAQCLDPRDRVYGLLGLATANPEDEDRNSEVVADYNTTPVTLFMQLLGTVSRSLYFEHALDLYNILGLHRMEKDTVFSSIPASLANVKFEVAYTHVGHLRHVTNLDQTVCKWCNKFKDEHTPFELSETHRAELQDKSFLEVKLGGLQTSMASHGVGPWYRLNPDDSCVSINEAEEGDDVFLLEGTNFILIRKQESKRYLRGVLACTREEASIPKAAKMLDILQPSLSSLEEVDLRTENSEKWVETIHEEFTLSQIVLLLAHTGKHSNMWQKALAS